MRRAAPGGQPVPRARPGPRPGRRAGQQQARRPHRRRAAPGAGSGRVAPGSAGAAMLKSMPPVTGLASTRRTSTSCARRKVSRCGGRTGLGRFVVHPEVVGQAGHAAPGRSRRFRQCDEQAEALHAGDAGREDGADLVGHEGGQVAVDGVALGQGGAALRAADVLAVSGSRRPLRRPARRAELQAGDQRAMHQQVGVAADRAGEMGVARQGEAEMADVVGAVGRLALAAQHHLVDQRRLLRAGDALQHAVEVARVQLVARRQADAHAVQDGAQRFELLLRGRRVDAVHAGAVQPLQLLGRGDVGEDHELLDQPVAVERGRGRTASTARRVRITWRSGRSRSSVPRACRAASSGRKAA